MGPMSPQENGPNSPHPQFHRLKSALALRRRSFSEFCQKVAVTPRHAMLVLTGERKGSQRLLTAMRREIGECAWSFVSGQADTLRDEGGGRAH